MDEALRRREREARGAGDPDSAAHLEAIARRSRGPLPRWNPFTRIRCTLAFACPKDWRAMATTDRPDVRFCDHCAAEVHEVTTEAEFAAHAAAGRCVSVPAEADLVVDVAGAIEPRPGPSPIELRDLHRLTGAPMPPPVRGLRLPAAWLVGLAAAVALLFGAARLAGWW